MGDLDKTISEHLPVTKTCMTDDEGEAFTRALMVSPEPTLRAYAAYVSRRIPNPRPLPPGARTPADPPPAMSDVASRIRQPSADHDDRDTARDLDAPMYSRQNSLPKVR